MPRKEERYVCEICEKSYKKIEEAEQCSLLCKQLKKDEIREKEKEKQREKELKEYHRVNNAIDFTRFTLTCKKCKKLFYIETEMGCMGVTYLSLAIKHNCPHCKTKAYVDEQEMEEIMEDRG